MHGEILIVIFVAVIIILLLMVNFPFRYTVGV